MAAISLNMHNSFISVHNSFAKNVPNPEFSGTTCVTILLKGRKLYSANAGDSRAILVDSDLKIR